jgi:predicted ester cyclase
LKEERTMSADTSAKSMSIENRLAARRWVEAFNARDDVGEADARTVDYIGHAPDGLRLPALDGDAWVAFLNSFLEGFPDLHLKVLDTVADEEMNAQRILFTGTHTGHFRGLPPTGRTVRFSGLELSRMVGGKAAEHWFQMDTLTLFEQLGLRIVPGPRLLPRLITAPLKRLAAKLR